MRHNTQYARVHWITSKNNSTDNIRKKLIIRQFGNQGRRAACLCGVLPDVRGLVACDGPVFALPEQVFFKKTCRDDSL